MPNYLGEHGWESTATGCVDISFRARWEGYDHGVPASVPSQLFVGARTISLEDLARAITPDQTVLLLGSGASVPSGAPTGVGLAAELATKLGGDPGSADLEEACSILEETVGRERLVAAVRETLNPLRPSGGLLTLAEYPWRRLYTTNFDRLVELAYQRARKDLAPIRSNFDYQRGDRLGATQLLKLHGCVSQDIVDGGPGRMVLTEFDYDDYASFREALFRQLDSDLLTSDVLIVGQSLSDRHLKAVVTQAAHLQATRGAQGRLFLLVYEPDKARASLYHRRGITTSSGSLEDFFYVLSATQPPVDPEVVDDAQRLLLKPTLRTAALDVDQVTGSANAARLFNGRPATYADIRAQLTFMRSAHPRLVGFMQGPDRQFLTLLGVAGVGKTTLARQLMLGLLGEGNYCWEAVKELPLSAEEWLHVDDQLREQGAEGVLLIDECTPELRQVNLLADGLAARGAGGLKLILTASSVQWRPRRKSPALYAKGHEETLSLLDTGDVRRMVELVETQPAIRDLADDAFRRLTTGDKLTRLTARASADMFVCLKYIFATEALDTILLEEYAKLQESQREIYRLVAALQASGGKVHRQMVLRQASLRADQIPDFLRSMEGIVDEHEASRKLGIYVWDTRHELIARVIAAYSYSDESELAALLADVIQNLSPTMHIELQSLREMCNAEFGVRALREPSERIRLFRLMIEVAPQERIPRHRIIREHLALGDLDSASYAVREAEEAVGLDRPVQRYKVQLDLQRAKSLTMAPEHRLAMLRSAERGALYALERFPDDKFSYSTYGDVGVAFGETTGDLGPLDEALRHLADASERLLDPQLSEDLLRFDRVRERLRGKASQEKR